MNDCTRRRLLAATGAVAGVGAVAGCLGDGDEEGANGSGNGDEDGDPGGDADDGTGDDGAGARVGTALGDITVDNLHDESHEVDVQVEIDGSTEAWRTVGLEARTGGVALDREWSTDGTSFRVRVRLDGDQFREVTPADWNGPDCVSLFVVITRDGDLRIAGDTTGGHCAS